MKEEKERMMLLGRIMKREMRGREILPNPTMSCARYTTSLPCPSSSQAYMPCGSTPDAIVWMFARLRTKLLISAGEDGVDGKLRRWPLKASGNPIQNCWNF